MTAIVEAPVVIETAENLAGQIGDIITNQTVNVVNSGNTKIVDWFLEKAMENPALAQLTETVHQLSLNLTPQARGEDLAKIIDGVLIGAGTGLLIGGLVIRGTHYRDGEFIGTYREASRLLIASVSIFATIGFLFGVVSAARSR